MRIVAAAAAAYARGGYFTVVEGIVIPRWLLAPLRDVLREADLAVAYAVLRQSFEACAERVDSREGGPLADRAAIEQLWREFAGLGEYESHAIDVTGREPGDVADAVAARLAAGDLAI
jgi:hypothetical protein